MSQPLSKRAAENAAASPDPKRLKKDRDDTPSRVDSGAESSSRKDKDKDGKKEKRSKEQKAQEKEDNELQKHLLNNDETLRRLFIHLASEKPEDISNKEFARRFWAARWYLIEDERERRRQQKASSHVFSQLKTRREEGGAPKLSITREQVGQIFKQYPVVRRVYNDIVTRTERPVAETAFWSRFFSSRLFKSLKGEPYTDHDPKDPEIDKDKYLKDEEEQQPQEGEEQHVPMFIDLEGNESNTKWKGNVAGEAIDPTMRARRRPILNILNNMSEKILAQVTPNDSAPAHAPIGMDEATYNELRLRDLVAETEDDRVILHIRDQARLQGGASEANHSSTEAKTYAKQNPSKVLANLTKDLKSSSLGKGNGASDLSTLLSFTPPSAPNDLDSSTATTSSAGPVTTHLANLLDQQSHLLAGSSKPTVLSRLQEPLRDNLLLSFHSLTEFLHIFHSILFTLPPSINPLTTELKPLLSTLTKTIDVRVADLAAEAGRARQDALNKMRREAEEVRARTAGRRRVEVDERAAPPGKKNVLGLVAPMVRAVEVAKSRFEALVRESTARI